MNIARVVLGAAILAAFSCGKTPTGPTASEPLPFVRESSSTRYYHEPRGLRGRRVAGDRQRVGAGTGRYDRAQNIEYRKYRSRADMGRYTGHATTNGFRGIQDQTLSYRVAGSFVLHMTERFGLPAVLQFFRPVNSRDESLDVIRARVLAVFGVSLEDIEATWLTMRLPTRAPAIHVGSSGFLPCEAPELFLADNRDSVPSLT